MAYILDNTKEISIPVMIIIGIVSAYIVFCGYVFIGSGILTSVGLYSLTKNIRKEVNGIKE